MSQPIRVTIWNEFVHELEKDHVRAIYPDGIHSVIAAGLTEQLATAVEVRTATLHEPEHGLTEAVLAETDVLMWWGHKAHGEVADEIRLDLVDDPFEWLQYASKCSV